MASDMSNLYLELISHKLTVIYIFNFALTFFVICYFVSKLHLGSITSNSGAVAVYRSLDGRFPLNWAPTSVDGLLDAVVWGDTLRGLSMVLIGNTQPVS